MVTDRQKLTKFCKEGRDHVLSPDCEKDFSVPALERAFGKSPNLLVMLISTGANHGGSLICTCSPVITGK